MEESLSRKLRVTTFIAIILVVLDHSYNLQISFKTDTVFIDTKTVTAFIENIFSRGFARIAVPLFFMVSGYLFYASSNLSSPNFRNKILKRIRTLAVPFLIWSTLSFVIVYIFQLLPGTEGFFANYHLRNCSLSQFLEVIFIYPISFQLFFVRDLFLYVLLTPITFYVLRMGGISVVLGLGIICLGEFLPGWPVFRPSGFFYFTAGNFIAIWGKDLQLTISKPRWLIPLWFIILAVKAYYLTYHGVPPLWLHNSGVLIGLAAFWFNYDLYGHFFERNRIFRLTAYTFFIYASHQPLLVVFHKIWAKLWAASEINVLTGYFICPLLVLLICTLVAVLLKRYCRGLYDVLTGSR